MPSVIFGANLEQERIDLIERRHPGQRAAELITDWTDALLHIRTGNTNVLGVNGVDDLGMTAFEGLVDGLPLPAILDTMRAQAPDRGEAALETLVTRVREAFAGSVLAPLVRD